MRGLATDIHSELTKGRRLLALVVLLVFWATACGGKGSSGIDDSFCHGIEDGTSCDDNNPCTEDDRCGLGVCLGQPAEEGLACDDGSLCSTDDVCSAGVCKGSAVNCNDLNGPCRVGVCDGLSGECRGELLEDGVGCDDGNACTVGDQCSAGACSSGTEALDCDDDDPCTDDACLPEAGCTRTPAELAGCCLVDADCEDGNPCTTATCDLANTWCLESTVEGACDDNNPCTEGDSCEDGICVGSALDCDDGNDCTLDACDEVIGCTTTPLQVEGCCASDPDCEDDNPCTETHCDVAQSWCVATPLAGACDDGNACTTGDVCAEGICSAGGGALACDDDEVCTDDSCDPASGCVFSANEGPCQDGDPCTTGDRCSDGACSGTVLDCSVLDGPCRAGACNPEDSTCYAEPAPNGQLCDDGDECSFGESCNAGLCNGGIDLCFCEDQQDGTPCDDTQACTTYDACLEGDCVGVTKYCAPPEEECRVAACDLTSGDCLTVTAEDGAMCNDGDPCTEGDLCTDGVCAGVDTCFCHVNPEGTPCIDENPCTDGETCQGGECLGSPIDCTAENDICNVGACDAMAGTCVKQPRPTGTACDDDDPCTELDGCLLGSCSGTPVDCSGLDTVCTQGTCEASTGACLPTPRPDGTPCDDDSPCSGHDDCTGGICGGEIALCGACGALTAGEACDDGDPCTGPGVCVADGDLLLCTAPPMDCSQLDDACVLGTCSSATGECGTTARSDGAPCDDGLACTLQDGCVDGSCQGSAVAMCGVPAPDACEAPHPNDMASHAMPVALAGPSASVVGWIEPAGELDWFAVDLLAGQRVSISVGPRCASVLDTQLGLYASDGATMLAYNDDSDPGGGWSSAQLYTVPSDGTYYVTLSAYEASGTGSYVLSLSASFPSCANDEDCDCADLVCSAETCVPATPGEAEPNGSAATASALNTSAAELETGPLAMHGAITGVDDHDWFSLRLPAGVSLDFASARFCGSTGETRLRLFAADGVTEVAGGASNGTPGTTLITGLVLQEEGAYLLRVSGRAGAVGAYQLTVSDGGCSDSCACQDQTCLDEVPDDAFKGLCLPANPAPETGNVIAALLQPGERATAEIGAPYDSDLFEIDLGAGAWDIRTEAYCGAGLDTRLELLDPGGDPIASDEDSGQDANCPFCAAIIGHPIPAATKLRIRVRAHGASVGAYVLTVLPAN